VAAAAAASHRGEQERAIAGQVLVAEHDLCGLLLDLVTAVLAMGEEI